MNKVKIVMLATVMSASLSALAAAPQSWELSGIGAALTNGADGSITVGEVLPGPAAKSGKIHEGDRVLAITENGKTTNLAGKKAGEAASLIRGKAGEKVTLEIQPAGSQNKEVVELTREHIQAK